ncbi:MAG TPA: Ppx/GppA phosphatase family protein [Thermoanaerobaculia bacterium]|nr:Ppx/GppA phosphatase family protein [Thermoanaerobaculia bacterium]
MKPRTAARHPASPTGPIAAVDLGSNSFHLLVARLVGGEVATVDRDREMVSLAAGLGPRGGLAPDARHRALDCLRRFGQRLRRLPPANVRAVGTNTLRRARDRERFLAEAEQALGHSIEVISGIEEARLTYLGVARTLGDEEGRRLVLDIGGGSTEVILGERSRPLLMESLYIGCVGLSAAHFPGGRVTKDGWRKATLAVRQELEPILTRFGRLGWERAAGSSGTVRSVAKVLSYAGWTEGDITAPALDQLRARLLDAGDVRSLEAIGMGPERAPVFAGGLAILAAAFEAFGIERLAVSEGALREGVLYDLLGRIHDEDTRSRTVQAVMDRYHVDREHAERVEATARHLLDQVAGAWKLEDEDSVRALSWAALVHEIGLDIAHSHYHRHGAYVIENADLPGFALSEQALIATLVRAHRRKLPVELFEGRPRSWLRLAVLLRIAVALHRSRGAAPSPPRLALEEGKRSLALRFPAGWLDQHPLTAADLDLERRYLESAGFDLTVV